MTLIRRRRSSQAEAAHDLALLVTAPRDELDSGQLVRALARSVLHIPMPDAPSEPRPRRESSSQAEGPPLYVLEDDDGQHALAYTTPRRLVAAWGGITAATVPFSTLILGWPSGVDLVLDAGLPEALALPAEVLRLAALEVGGLPTAAGVSFSPDGVDVRRPGQEPQQVMGHTVVVADRVSEVKALYRAELVNREPAPRPLLAVVVRLQEVDDERRSEIGRIFVRAIAEVDPQPVAVLLDDPGSASAHQQLIDSVIALDPPYWQRNP